MMYTLLYWDGIQEIWRYETRHTSVGSLKREARKIAIEGVCHFFIVGPDKLIKFKGEWQIETRRMKWTTANGPQMSKYGLRSKP